MGEGHRITGVRAAAVLADLGFTAVASGELGWLHTLRATTLDPAPPPAHYIPRSGGLLGALPNLYPNRAGGVLTFLSV